MCVYIYNVHIRICPTYTYACMYVCIHVYLSHLSEIYLSSRASLIGHMHAYTHAYIHTLIRKPTHTFIFTRTCRLALRQICLSNRTRCV